VSGKKYVTGFVVRDEVEVGQAVLMEGAWRNGCWMKMSEVLLRRKAKKPPASGQASSTTPSTIL
jgi:hypothetical protein